MFWFFLNASYHFHSGILEIGLKCLHQRVAQDQFNKIVDID